jgi:uncharacterized tellurite resistance protein B-like protein
MLDRLREIFQLHAPERPRDSDTLALAAAALLVEAAMTDGVYEDDERAGIIAALERQFDIPGPEAEAAATAAEAAMEDSNDLHRFTRRVKDELGYEDRVHLIEMLWEVVYADGRLHDHEASLMRRIGGLLYVSDRDRGLARRRVLDRLN